MKYIAKCQFPRKGHATCPTALRTTKAVIIARMGQPQVRATVSPDVARLREVAERTWPGHGKRAVDRLAREAIRGYMKKPMDKVDVELVLEVTDELFIGLQGLARERFGDMSEEAVGRDREESIRRTVVDAWWELDTLGPHGSPEYGSPAWVVERVFIWVADEERSLHWVARELNRMDIPTAGGRRWKPAKVHRLVANPCYTGKHSYNVHARVPTPGQSLADITAKIKRNRKERKPESEWVHFEVPALVSEERGRGPINCSASAAAVEADRGGLSKPCSGVASTAHSVTNLWWSAGTLGTITSTIIAKYTVGNGTQCHAPTLLLFLARGMKSYGLIPAAYYATIAGWTPSFRPWQNKDETLAGSSVQETKMAQMKHQIAKVQEGFEGEIYTLEEAQSRTLQLQVSIKDVEGETERLRRRAGAGPTLRGNYGLPGKNWPGYGTGTWTKLVLMSAKR